VAHGDESVQADIKAQIESIRRNAVQLVSEDELARKLAASIEGARPLRVKYGMDPSAPDIHLGHCVPLRELRRFQDMGHQAVLIIGDYTAMVGDPSGKEKTRPQLTHEEVTENARTYLEQAGKVLDMSRVQVVRNSEWFHDLAFADMLKLCSQITVARMLDRDSFAKRLAAGNPIGVHEFIYCIMQAYDSIAVKADIELGGSDQTFNLMVAREYQRNAGMEPEVVITFPILVGLDGSMKMSKSLGNYVGVTEPPDEKFGKLMSISDESMPDYFSLLTDLSSTQVRDLLAGHPMEAKKRLAHEVVSWLDSPVEADAAQARFERVFSKRQVPEDMPDVVVTTTTPPPTVVELVRLAGFAESNSDARRLVCQGAVKLDGEKMTDIDVRPELSDGQVLQVGKRRFGRIRISE